MERRRGRRDNGLDAADFAPVGDLDPRLAEHLLDLLGARGIAAYLQPSLDINPITRSFTLPARPTDRIFADRAHLSTARDYLRRLVAEERATEPPPGPSAGPPAGEATGTRHDQSGGPPADPEPATGRTPARRRDPVDATFEGIVAGFDRPVDPTAAAWPAAENLTGTSQDPPAGPPPEPPGAPPETPEAPASLPGPPGPVDARDVTEPSLLDGLDTFGADLPDEPGDERFVPPPPPPLPRLSRQTMLGGLAILVGLVLVLAPGLTPFGRGDSVTLGFVALVGGAVALILRLRPGTDPDEDQHPDDGARV